MFNLSHFVVNERSLIWCIHGICISTRIRGNLDLFVETLFSAHRTTTTTHTIERKEITISHSSYNANNFSQGASPSSFSPSSSSHTHEALQSPPFGLLKRSPGVQPIIERGFKHYGYRMRLYCRTGYSLTVLHDKSVHTDELLTHPGGETHP